MSASAALPSLAASQFTQEHSAQELCWICMDDSGAHSALTRLCRCPRWCHRECLAQWQLHSYGKSEEKACRFCGYSLPALWKPDAALDGEAELNVAPVMQVRYNGPNGTSRDFKMRVRPGPEGLALFKLHIKEVLGIDIGPEFDVSFQCQMPYTGSPVTLSGLHAYGAATQCAAVLAATKTGAACTSSAPPSKRHEQLLPCPRPGAALAPAPTRNARSGRRSCQTGYLVAPLVAPRSPPAQAWGRPCAPAAAARTWLASGPAGPDSADSLVSGTDLEALAAALARPAANQHRASSAGHLPPTRFRAAVTGFYAASPLPNPESLFRELGLGATCPAGPSPSAASAPSQDHPPLHVPQQQQDGAAASSGAGSVPPSLATSRRSSTDQPAPSSASCASEASMDARSSTSSRSGATSCRSSVESNRSSAACSSLPQPAAAAAAKKQRDAAPAEAASQRRLRLPEVARRTVDSLMRVLRPEKKTT